MSKKLKVYGCNTFLFGVQERTVAAVTSQKQFAALIKTSLNYVRDYAAETGNVEEVNQAFSHCGVAHVQCKCCGTWRIYQEKT